MQRTLGKTATIFTELRCQEISEIHKQQSKQNNVSAIKQRNNENICFTSSLNICTQHGIWFSYLLFYI